MSVRLSDVQPVSIYLIFKAVSGMSSLKYVLHTVQLLWRVILTLMCVDRGSKLYPLPLLSYAVRGICPLFELGILRSRIDGL